ncbi:ATP-binding protein [Uliginosibacterium aquaticum]|uniref:histidine kinase n=1 Tax=Uliginosibacterium aquaticum TaxID=2731212 RepID=A0ABX2IN48_9RHOO|nr:ATP-binding protein [Uliginosibacterium aquaticum]NSL55465.1 PAS domain-containing protein [Uliginosibacterium aquaticum]
MRSPHLLARRLFRQLLPAYLLLAAALTALQLFTLYGSTRQAIDGELNYLARAFSPSLGEALWAMDRRQLADLAAGIERSPVVSAIRISDEAGRVLIWAGNLDARQPAGMTPLRVALEHAVPGADAITVGHFELYSSHALVLAQMRYSLLATLLNSFVMAAALWALFYWIIHRELSQPLAAMAEALRHWRKGAAGEMAQPAYPHRDELGSLLAAFAEARSRLDTSLQALATLNTGLENEVGRRTQELSEAKQRLELSLAAGRLGCWEWELDSGRNRFDARWKQMLGYVDTELEESLDTFTALVHRDDLPRLMTAAQALTSGKIEQYRVDMRMRCKSGEYRWIQSCGEVTARSADGTARRLSGTHQDITERKQAEQALLEAHAENARMLSTANASLSQRVAERTRELEAANQSLRETLSRLESTHLQLAQSEKLATLGKLVALFAHDISNPISNSWMASGILDENLASVRRKQAEGTLRQRDLSDFLDTVSEARKLLDRNLERAHELLEGFKDMALDQATSMRRQIMLRSWLEQLGYTLSPMFKGRGTRLEFNIPPDLELDTSPGPLAQVITNLVSNALTHAFPAGNAGDDTQQIRIEAKRDETGCACLQISDNGSGMSPEVQARIFEPFFTTRAGQGGTGLGLDIVRNIVEDTLGGQIEVHSTPGAGSQFHIRLPGA